MLLTLENDKSIVLKSKPVRSMPSKPSDDAKSAQTDKRGTLSTEAKAVREALVANGLETPMTEAVELSSQKKYLRIKSLMTEVLETLGLDLEDDSLHESPHRISKMYVNEIFSGLDYSNFPRISVVDNKMQTDDAVTVEDIKLTSTCEHHFVVIDGYAKISYIPKDKVIGLSKINRVVKFFAQRPQIQERLTRQILVALQTLLGTDDVAVSINARHYCVIARGVEDTSSSTETKALGGLFKADPGYRAEFSR